MQFTLKLMIACFVFFLQLIPDQILCLYVSLQYTTVSKVSECVSFVNAKFGQDEVYDLAVQKVQNSNKHSVPLSSVPFFPKRHYLNMTEQSVMLCNYIVIIPNRWGDHILTD